MLIGCRINFGADVVGLFYACSACTPSSSRAVGTSNTNRSIRHFLGIHVVVRDGLGVVILTTDVCSVNPLDYYASLLFGLCNVQT